MKKVGYRCRKCGGYGHQDHPTGVCSGLFDPYHTTGRPDMVRIDDFHRAQTAEQFVKAQHNFSKTTNQKEVNS